MKFFAVVARGSPEIFRDLSEKVARSFSLGVARQERCHCSPCETRKVRSTQPWQPETSYDPPLYRIRHCVPPLRPEHPSVDGPWRYPGCGTVNDFYPGVGEFGVDVHRVPIEIAGEEMEVTAGSLPDELSPLLEMVRADGILGNQILADRPVGLFPRRGELILGERRAP